MSFEIIPLKRFQKDVKGLQKRYPKIKSDLQKLSIELQNNPTQGIPLGDGFYKLRVANSSIPTGKSGGFRVITYYLIDETLYLVTIYAKGDQDSISHQALQEIIKNQR